KPNIPFASGAPQGPPDQTPPFTLRFDTPGTYSYDCQIHGPTMVGTIVVVASGAALSETSAQTQARGQGERAAALGGAGGALQGPTAPNGGAPLAVTGGSTIYPVTAGVEPNANAAALAFFPNNLTVHQGDTVVFTQTDPQEIHTVTLLSGNAP